MTHADSMTPSRVAVALTAGRLILVPALLGAMLHLPRTLLPAALVAVFVALDVLDGWYARRNGVDTPQRRLMDSIVDKAVVHVPFVCALVVYGLHPGWYFPVLARDALVSLVGLAAVRRFNSVLYPNLVHKVGMLALAAAGAAITLQLGTVTIVALLLSWILLYVSAVDYIGLYAKRAHSGASDRPAGLVGQVTSSYEGWRFICAVVRRMVMQSGTAR